MVQREDSRSSRHPSRRPAPAPHDDRVMRQKPVVIGGMAAPLTPVNPVMVTWAALPVLMPPERDGDAEVAGIVELPTRLGAP